MRCKNCDRSIHWHPKLDGWRHDYNYSAFCQLDRPRHISLTFARPTGDDTQWALIEEEEELEPQDPVNSQAWQ